MVEINKTNKSTFGYFASAKNDKKHKNKQKAALWRLILIYGISYFFARGFSPRCIFPDVNFIARSTASLELYHGSLS